MKHEAIRIVNGRMIVGDILEMKLTDVLERASSSAIPQALNRPDSTHLEWAMIVKDVIDDEGRIFRVEGLVRITEANSREEAAAWGIEVDRYWDSLNEQRERNESHGRE